MKTMKERLKEYYEYNKFGIGFALGIIVTYTLLMIFMITTIVSSEITIIKP